MLAYIKTNGTKVYIKVDEKHRTFGLDRSTGSLGEQCDACGRDIMESGEYVPLAEAIKCECGEVFPIRYEE